MLSVGHIARKSVCELQLNELDCFVTYPTKQPPF